MPEQFLCNSYPSTFPSDLVKHCCSSFIPPELFRDIAAAQSTFPRFLRLHPTLVQGTEVDLSERLIARLLNDERGAKDEPLGVVPVAWLPCFCVAIPRTVAVSCLPSFQRGSIIAMDAASMAAVVALKPRLGDRVLDVCCAPGMKLNLIADAVGSTGLAIGVDISVQRLFVARSQVLKHQQAYLARDASAVPSIGLFVADGRTTCSKDLIASQVLDRGEDVKVHATTGLTAREEHRLKALRKRQRNDQTVCLSAAPPTVSVVYASESTRQMLSQEKWDGLYDRVLVDAECSHDGSISHLRFPAMENNEAAVGQGISNARRMQKMNIHASEEGEVAASTPPDEELARLQLELLLSGYAQLRCGGVLVYSTCSFSFWQNEYIIHRFLQMVNGEGEKASVCNAFSFDCGGPRNEKDAAHIFAPCMQETPDDFANLRARLDETYDSYGIVTAGSAAIGATAPLALGARFYPSEFRTSFQYVAKIVKLPFNT